MSLIDNFNHGKEGHPNRGRIRKKDIGPLSVRPFLT